MLSLLKKFFIDYRLTIAGSFLLFLIIGIVFYFKRIKPKSNKVYADNREFVDPNKESDTNTATLYLFHTDWCPLCKKAMPEWNAFKKETNGVFDGVTVNFQEVNCDRESDIADRFNIDGYPTIKLQYQNKIYEYDAKPDRVILNKFLTEIFNNP